MTECIEWPGPRTHRGYGRIKTRKNRNRRAHVVAWEEVHGPVPDGLMVRHMCDNPPCINPDHLEIGTHADNMRDMVSRGRAYHSRGELQAGHKLTEEQARAIKYSTEKGVVLAATYGVSTATICLIRKGKNWGWLT